MPMHEMADTIRMIHTYAAVVCAAAVGVVLTGVAFACGARMLAQSAKKLAVLSLVGAMLVGGMVVVGTDDAGAKPSTNVVNQVEGVTNTVGQTGGGTNDWTNVEGMNTVGQTDGEGTNGTGSVSGPLTMERFGRPNLMHGLPPSITDDDIVAGWREVSRSTDALAASVFARPDDAFVWEAAMARGARRGYWRIPFGCWDFPGGGASWTNGFVWAEGMFRPRVESKRNGFLLLDHHLALAPAANWSRFGLDASLFWCRTNAVGGLVGTFLGAAMDDDPAKIVNAQFELFPSDGRIALRYDLARAGEGPFLVGPFENGTNHFATVSSNTAEIVFQRVHHDDWDMDGIPNSMDDDPRVAAANGGWNQSEAWAMLAFPSNAAEIAAMGYMAWATARAEDPNRRLVGLHVSSSDGSWPLHLTFGGLQVMCDGKQELVFAIDCGAKYSYSVSGGRLDRVTVHGEQDYEIHCEDNPYIADDEGFYPHYCSFGWPCDLDVHLESPGCGYMIRVPEVQIVEDVEHLFPNEGETISAVVTNCHGDAYIDCTWIGGSGISFSNEHSLTTTVTWNGPDPVAWTTNYVALVTTYAGGYAVTNGHYIGVGSQSAPTTTFSASCSPVQFLNDGIGGDRPERVYKLSLDLLAGHGEGGTVSFTCDGPTGTRFYHDLERTAPITEDNPLWLNTPMFGAFGSGAAAYMTSTNLGRATVRAVLSGNEMSHVASVPIQVIEPIRKLVNNLPYEGTDMIMNPCRLVRGTNAVLTVSVNLADGDTFDATNVTWSVVSGAVHRVSEVAYGNNWYLTVAPSDSSGAADEEVVIEAKFNDDPIQPRFVLPVVDERVLKVKAFVVQPPENDWLLAWEENDVRDSFKTVNKIFAQSGVRFLLEEVQTLSKESTNFWNFVPIVSKGVVNGTLRYGYTDQFYDLLNAYPSNDCIKVFFVGHITEIGEVGAFMIPYKQQLQGVFISRDSFETSLAHELGHVLGLDDCRAYYNITAKLKVYFQAEGNPVTPPIFPGSHGDWGMESGRGFYGKEDTCERVFDKMLMNQYTEYRKVDILDRTVFSWIPTGTNTFTTGTVRVGAYYFIPSNRRIYTHED